ncbi:MAG: xanthine dehydrogenase family protein subunit M [Gemmatimonadetes bacterium]|nr:xanthine dehydrogenase family protein subunit M [Gemmatimonadota bacterium]MYE15686.1 xanthine dehydrogenase family protein subunit M [Gemmatimonadota bacterium]
MMNDMMTHFDLLQPADLDSALDLLSRHGSDAWPLAGGYDSFDWFKNRGKQPGVVIDLEGVEELRGVREGDPGADSEGGITIGSMTTLAAVEGHPLIQSRYSLLAAASAQVASPQIRNAGTIGGNVCQDTRCWYYRYGMTCYRAGGNTCYAGARGAMNREHAIFGADRCVAVTPSDVAPALVALDAEMVVRSAGRDRVVPAAEFFMQPSVDITRMTVLEPDELLTAIRIPGRWAGADFHFEKVADRKTWDFALVSVAAAVRDVGGVIEDARIVAGAVQCIPRRMTEVEDLVRGRPRDEETAEMAGALAIRGADPLDYNHFKIPLLRNLVKRAVRPTA